jgi:hypothetical protein
LLVALCRKNQKALEAAVAEIGYAGLPRFHSRAVSGAYLALRGETLALLELRRQVSVRNRQHLACKASKQRHVCVTFGLKQVFGGCCQL